MRLLILIILAGCAASSKKDMRGSTADLVVGKQKPIKVSAELDHTASLEKYRLAKIYLQNLEHEWIRVKSAEVTEIENNENYHVILGSDLETWLKSFKLNSDLIKEAQKKENKSVVPFLKNYDIKDHLYERFAIPGKLQTEKWVLVQLSNTNAKWFLLKLNFIDNTSQIYKLELK